MLVCFKIKLAFKGSACNVDYVCACFMLALRFQDSVTSPQKVCIVVVQTWPLPLGLRESLFVIQVYPT